jgi:hypothetical protein
MDRIDIIHKMVKEASDSGIIPKHADLPTYTRVWESFSRMLDIVIKEIEE